MASRWLGECSENLKAWVGVQGQKFEYLLNTGNLISRSGLDLSQATGFTVVAEKLNFFRQVTSLLSPSPPRRALGTGMVHSVPKGGIDSSTAQ